MTLTHAAVIAASIYVLIEVFKRLFPGWKKIPILVRIMPVMGVLVGAVVAPLIGHFAMGIHWLLSVPYGIVAGALSSTCYELLHKTLSRRLVGVYEEVMDDPAT